MKVISQTGVVEVCMWLAQELQRGAAFNISQAPLAHMPKYLTPPWTRLATCLLEIVGRRHLFRS